MIDIYMNKTFKYSLNDIIPFLPENHKIYSSNKSTSSLFSTAKPLTTAGLGDITFIDKNRPDKQELYNCCTASVLICDHEIIIDDSRHDQVVIKVDSPKVIFSIILNTLLVSRPGPGIHPTAYISSQAEIHPAASIGAFAYVGNCKVGSGTIIYGNCYLYDRVRIGDNVIIHSGAVLGADGFGYNRLPDGKPIQFPHVGNLIIDDYVEIGANTTIDQGALGDTHIKYATKIDNLVHIGHNVNIGKCCYIAAQTAIAGSTIIGDYSEVWMGVGIADGIKIGARTTAGIGSVIIRDIEKQNRVFGNPARVIADNQ